MYYLFGFTLFASFATAVTLVVRKFPQLVNLDVENLPFERESQKKKELLRQRLEHQGRSMQERWGKYLQPFKKVWGKLQLQFRIYVGKVERLLHHEQRLKIKAELKAAPPEQTSNRLETLVADGFSALEQGSLDQAEEFFITAIKLDSAYTNAYRGLADTYAAKGTLDEAMETYAFVHKLVPEDDTVLAKMAELAEAQGKIQEAIEYYQQAVVLNDSLSPRFYHLAELLLKENQVETAKEAVLSAVDLEPKNPKYLDLLIETAILAGDRKIANEAWAEFRLINPENKKLQEFRQRIDQI